MMMRAWRGGAKLTGWTKVKLGSFCAYFLGSAHNVCCNGVEECRNDIIPTKSEPTKTPNSDTPQKIAPLTLFLLRTLDTITLHATFLSVTDEVICVLISYWWPLHVDNCSKCRELFFSPFHIFHVFGLSQGLSFFFNALLFNFLLSRSRHFSEGSMRRIWTGNLHCRKVHRNKWN